MIEFTSESHDHILIGKVSGKIIEADYQNIIIPKLDSLLATHGKISVLIEFDADFKGWELKAFCTDIKYGLSHRKDFTKIGMVNAPCYVVCLTKTIGCLVTAEIKTFATDSRDQALAWINAD